MTARIELFEGLSDPDVADLRSLASRVTLQPGEVLFRIGNEADHLYLIEDGLIELTMPLQVGGRDEKVRIEERRAGQTLGWSTLVPPHRFTLDANAPLTTSLLAFPRDMLLAHFAGRPAVGYVVLRNVAVLVGQRLQVLQAMWLRQMQHMVNLTHA
jgi:CRP-like cAMP-binding protein